jgi:inhibitor of KinA
MIKNLESLIKSSSKADEIGKNRLVKIPVLYGGEKGPDIADVARINNLREQDVIEIHKSQTYRVYMLGFNPGFPYMGGLDKRIATPRLDEPRTKVPAGSVAIGGEQTGIYSITSPGGWRLIGHTPLELFNPKANDPTLLRAGDDIVFYQVNLDEYQQIENEVKNNTYRPLIEWVNEIE